VQKAEDVTAGVDSALEQLKHSMAAMAEMKEANKYGPSRHLFCGRSLLTTARTIVGEATPSRTPGHRRFPSKGFQHLAPSSSLGSPLLSVPGSPMRKPPTSQPAGSHDVVLGALRVPLIHLLAVKPSREQYLADTCRTSLANIRDLLPKIAKRSSDNSEKWQLTDKTFRDLNPFKFPYKSAEDREHAINSAVKSFDRLRLAKSDKLWQILLPLEERGQGKCLSRLNVKAPEPKQAKPSTPLHKLTKSADKKAAATKKVEDKGAEEAKKPRGGKDEVKPKKMAKEVKEVKEVKEKAPAVKEATHPASARAPTAKSATPSSNRNTPAAEASKIRTKKVAPSAAPQPRVKPRMHSGSIGQRDRAPARPRPSMPVNTKPKNPSPLSASPPVNASDFEDNHPVHKALSAAPSPAKTSSGNSDRALKRKANDIDSDIHNHNLSAKQARMDRPTPSHTPHSSTSSSSGSLKRKSDESSSSNDTPTSKIRKVNNIDTGLASRYPVHNTQISPADSSSSVTSPTTNLSFRQTVELSQTFQKYYKKYEELYWQLAEADTAPTEAQRNSLMKMHKKLEEMKREIKAGAGGSR
jgi:RNA polymerase II elongation factor ELL